MRAHVKRTRAHPGDNLFGRLVTRHGDELDDEELTGIGNLLLIAGHETTAMTIGLSVLTLLQHPDQLAVYVNLSMALLQTAGASHQA